jgi:hypothetical protein
MADSTQADLHQAVADALQSGGQILSEILAGAEAFLTGAKVGIAIDIPTQQINFTGKNPFGTTYNFSFFQKEGKVHLDGTPS